MEHRPSPLIVAKLEAIRKEVSGSELAPEHKDTLQAKVDEAVRLLEMPREPQHEDLVEAVQELKEALAERIGYDVRSEVRASARMRSAIFEAVRDGTAAAIGDALKRHREDCAAGRIEAAAPKPGAKAASGKAAEIAALESVPWPAVLKSAAMACPKMFFATCLVGACYFAFMGLGDRLLALLAGG